jgi:hypothetical protein
MMLLYAIVPPGARLPVREGIAGAPLEAVEGSAAAMVVERCGDPPDASEADSALAFAQIVAAIAEQTATLPIRFPTSLDSREAVLAELEARGGDWARRLGEIDGLCEVSIRARAPQTDPDDGAEPTGPGTAYLARRASALRDLEATAERIEHVAGQWARETRRLPAREGVRVACLVAKADVPALRGALHESLDSEFGGVEVAGPWPPFRFVEGRP